MNPPCLVRRYCLAALGGLLITLSGLLQAELQVEITGIEGELHANALARLSAQRERRTPGLSDALVRRYLQRGKQEIRQALEPFGYYDAHVDSRLEQTADGWRLRYAVRPGAPVLLRDWDIRIDGPGRQEPGLLALVRRAPLQRGVPLRHAQYEAFKRRLQQTAAGLGYLDAAYTRHELRIDPAAHDARMVLHLATGPRYRFGAVSFDADAGLAEELLRRFAALEPGAPYSDAQLLELQRALEDSGYFSQVDVVPQRELTRDRAIPIHVALTPRLRHLYSAGLGFGTDTGVRGSLGWEHRRINRRGHRMKAELRASAIATALSTQYSVPLGNPRHEHLDVTGTLLDEHSDTVETRVAKLGIGRTTLRGAWSETLSLNYQRENFRLGLTDDAISLLLPGVGYARVAADNRLVARRGHALQFDLRGAAKPLLSDVDFAQISAQAKLIRSLGQRVRLLARAQGGTTWTDNFAKLPATLRYFAGGDQSVRGYDFQALGPRDVSGKVVGAKHLLVASIEAEYRIHGNWGAALFVDTGNAFDDVGVGLETGAGVGLRWRSPIGMVRVDLASAVSADRALRLHFTLGPDL